MKKSIYYLSDHLGSPIRLVGAENYVRLFPIWNTCLQDIGFKDSGGSWTSTANGLGVYSNQDFLNSPGVQDMAMNMLLNKNWGYITNLGLQKYVDTSMNGITITESGLVAASHLDGIGGLQKALNNGDLTSVKDGNGTTALSYMTKFGGYNIDKINRFIKLFTAFVATTMLFGCAISQEQSNENIMLRVNNDKVNSVVDEMYKDILDNKTDIMLNMLNGNKNSVVSEIYARDIMDVENLTFAKKIIIEYYDCDLNSDGIVDKIVTVRSPLHSGSHGDTLDFLIGNGDGTYQQISGLIVQLYAQGEGYQSTSMYLLDSETDGFYDILINNNDGSVLDDQDTILLKYENGRYVP